MLSEQFLMLVQKISNTQTSGKNASHIRHIVRGLTDARNQMATEHKKEIVEVYAQKDENGKIKAPEDNKDGFIPADDKKEECDKASEAFFNREATIDWKPLAPSTLSDVRLSAREIDLLGELYSEHEGPGLPGLGPSDNVMAFPQQLQ